MQRASPGDGQVPVGNSGRLGQMSPPPKKPGICHIVHVDRLRSIVQAGKLWCDAEVVRRGVAGTTIGMNEIKRRRLQDLTLSTHPDLYVGDCVPFYFCPRSVMLYVIHCADHPELAYRDGQVPIVHLVADLRRVVSWAERKGRRWAFTTSNAGSRFFEDYADLAELDEIDWNAVKASQWRDCKEEKQAEFLLEKALPWKLVSRIGVMSLQLRDQVTEVLRGAEHRPTVEVKRNCYY